jgi:nitroreductase
MEARGAIMDNAIRRLLLAAVSAPSGDNTQPWRFIVNPEGTSIAFHLDPSRDPSPMNAGQRMARIAVGAALENLLRAALADGWKTELQREPGDALAIVHLSRGGETPGTIGDEITSRVTNRRVYSGTPITSSQLERLVQETLALDGVATHWITEKGRIVALAPVIGESDGTMFGNPAMRRAFLANVRFDEPPDARVAEGLSMASLELSAADRVALRVMKRAPDWLLKGRVEGVFRDKTRSLVESASGLCVIVAPDSAPQSDVVVGRAMQRAWLALTAQGMAVQPMMSLPVLENAMEHGDPALIAALGPDRVASLSEKFRALVPELAGARPAFLLRFGFADEPTGRTGRLPLESVTTGGTSSSD